MGSAGVELAAGVCWQHKSYAGLRVEMDHLREEVVEIVSPEVKGAVDAWPHERLLMLVPRSLALG